MMYRMKSKIQYPKEREGGGGSGEDKEKSIQQRKESLGDVLVDFCKPKEGVDIPNLIPKLMNNNQLQNELMSYIRENWVTPCGCECTIY